MILIIFLIIPLIISLVLFFSTTPKNFETNVAIIAGITQIELPILLIISAIYLLFDGFIFSTKQGIGPLILINFPFIIQVILVIILISKYTKKKKKSKKM